MKILKIFGGDKKMVERTRKSLDANPTRTRRSTKSTKSAKHGKGLSSSKRRKLAIQRAELEALRNPWLAW